MDQEGNPTSPLLHDLRHHLALLALDLRLTRGAPEFPSRPGRGESITLLALLGRLETGLAVARDLLGGGGGARAAEPANSAPLVLELWERFLRAGRLRAGACELALQDPLFLPGSFLALHTLLLNLLENATGAAPDGPLSLSVASGRISIENGGAPMPPSIAAALSEGGPLPPAGAHGWGLGAIRRSAAELGFVLTLSASDGLTRMLFERGRPGDPLLLIVEDDAGLRSMLAEYLRREGYRVDERESASPGEIAQGAYAGMIADFHLRDERGDRLLEACKRREPALRTILLTGDREAAGRDRPGVDAIVIKPGLDRLLLLLSPLRGVTT